MTEQLEKSSVTQNLVFVYSTNTAQTLFLISSLKALKNSNNQENNLSLLTFKYIYLKFSAK
jgi:hypothetical protein